MNREVEERIVAMYFDNQDFEKNAKTTIDTLGQLKEGLNLEKSAKGFDVFEKIGKNLNFEKMNQGLTKVRNGLSSMNGALGKVFKIGEAPVREAENMVNTIRGYISKVVGIDIASSLVHSVTSAFQGLVIQPISKGWNQYESEMDSVKTIMSSTGESLTVVEEHLKSMTEYANKTIYSLTDMTSNLGKFTNNGVKLDQSVKAMEGIANATADAGQGAQQASMAMYNISQAIGVGKMTTIDWKSLENANIATTKLKKTFLEMAALHGKIEKKTNKDGSISYMLTKDENGKKLKQSIELTTANFREYLSKGWLDKETMLRTFEIYSGSVKESTLESWGIHDKDQKKYFMELGQQALTSATQVRTFTKMMDALKESVQSGWSESFKWIFGDMEQGTELWTRLNDELDKVLSKSSENRNKILEVWAGRNTNIESETKALEQRQEALAEAEKKLKTLKDKKEIEKQKKLIEDYHKEIKSLKKTISDKKNLPKSTIVDKQGRSGRDIAIDSLFSAIKVFKRIGSTVSGAFESVFGKLNAQGLFDFTQKIEKAIKRISKWFGTLKQPESRLSKIQKALKGVLNIVKMLINFGGKLFNLAKKIAGPVIDFLIDGAANIFGFFDGLADKSPSEILEEVGKGLKSAWDEIKRWFTPHDITDDQGKVIGKEMPIVTWLKQGWEDLKKIVKDWIYESGFGEIYESVASWWDEFKKSVDEAYAGLKEWWEGTGIPEFFENIWNKITEWFTPKKTIKPILTESGSYVLTVEEEDMPIVAFFKNLGTTIDNAFKEVEKWWKKSGIPDFFEDMWNSIVKFFSPVEHTRYNGSMLETTYEDSPFVTFFKGLGSKIDSAYQSLKKWWKKSGIPDFFEDMWNSIVKFFSPVEHTRYNGSMLETTYEDSPIVAFFKRLWTGIQTVYEGLSNWWYNESGIPGFFEDMWNSVTGLFKPVEHTRYNGSMLETTYEDSPIVSFFKRMWSGIKSAYEGLEKWWKDTKVADFFSGIWESVKGWFNNEHEGEKSGFEMFLTDVGNGLKEAWGLIEGLPWEEIGKFFTDIWTFIAGLIAGGEEEAQEASGNTAQLKDVSQRHGGMIAAATDFISDVSYQTKKLSDTTEETAKDTPNASKTQKVMDFFSNILTKVADFFNSVIHALDGVVLPAGISDFLSNMGTFLEGLMSAVGNVLGSAGRLLKGESKNVLADLAWVLIPTVIGVVGQVFEFLHAKHLSGITMDSVSKQFMQLCIGVLALGVSVSLLSTIPSEKLWPAVAAITVLGGIIAAIFSKIEAMTVARSATSAPVKSSERILIKLIDTIGKVGMIATAMALLPNIIETIGKVKKEIGGGDVGQDILNAFLGLSALIASVSLTFAVVEKMTAGNGLSVAATAKTTLSLITGLAIIVGGFGVVIGLLGGVSELLGGKDNADKVVSVINQGAEILAAVGGAIGGFFASMFGGGTEGQKADQAKLAIEKWSEAADVLDEKKVSGVARLMSMVRNLTEQGKSIDPKKLDGFGAAMGKLGAGIYEYANFLKGDDSVYAALSDLSDPSSDIYKRLLAFNALGINLSELLGNFGEIRSRDAIEKIEFLAKDENIDKLVKNLNKIITGLGDLNNPETGIQFDGLTIVKKLYDAIQDGLINPSLPKFDATSVIDDICEAIGLGDSAIALLVHNMVQKGLGLSGSNGEGGGGKYPTVTEDTSWLDPELAEKLGGLTNLGTSMDLTGIEKQIEELTGKDGSIAKMIESIPNMGDVMDSKGWTNFTDADGKPIDILGGLQDQMTQLSTTLNETPLQVTITPVFDMKNLTAEGVQKALSENHVPLFFNTEGMRVDFSGLNQALDMDGIKSRLDVIAGNILLSRNDQVSSITSLGSHMDYVGNTIAALKLYLDTGLLVGALTPMIDRELYKEWLKH